MSTSTLDAVTTTAPSAPRDGTRTGARRTAPARPASRGQQTGHQTGQQAGQQAGQSAEQAVGGTAPFVLLIMVLLAGGLVTTLWLSTAAAADSYRLDAARQSARELSEQTERLHRDVAAREAAPALAAAASGIGMVPAGEPAVLVVAPDGTSRVIGTPAPARAAARPAAPAPSAPVAAPAPAPARAAVPEDAREQSAAR